MKKFINSGKSRLVHDRGTSTSDSQKNMKRACTFFGLPSRIKSTTTLLIVAAIYFLSATSSVTAQVVDRKWRNFGDELGHNTCTYTIFYNEQKG